MAPPARALQRSGWSGQMLLQPWQLLPHQQVSCRYAERATLLNLQTGHDAAAATGVQRLAAAATGG